ncbi:hypothetical protein PILCRDRAFT_508638 [Piloderma croceum F 1598]|uniref:Uncharacterized protein n=1 Tax=Piloderma croceum (strain F 1598) TaxID=765440 RepID=A0A0C3B407_PILCF|nr:hypothetical protein PILCRDRAFT_508638 [Piloderma croceum F 1598]
MLNITTRLIRTLRIRKMTSSCPAPKTAEYPDRTKYKSVAKPLYYISIGMPWAPE